MEQLSTYFLQKMENGKVSVVDNANNILKCGICGESWKLLIRRSGKVSNSFWKCPNGCSDGEPGEKNSPVKTENREVLQASYLQV